jgi:hypothetical protein
MNDKIEVKPGDEGKLFKSNLGKIYTISGFGKSGVIWAHIYNDPLKFLKLFETEVNYNGYFVEEITPNEYPQYFV